MQSNLSQPIQTVTIYKAPQKGKGQKLLEEGFQPGDFPDNPPYVDGCCYFAGSNDRSIAEDCDSSAVVSDSQPISTSPQTTVSSMDSQSWEQIKSKYKLGQFVQGQVECHAPFGVFVDVGELSVKGLIRIPDFLDEGEMSEEMYPELGTSIGAIVVGYNESNYREIYLNAKPSILHEALVPLKNRAVAV